MKAIFFLFICFAFCACNAPQQWTMDQFAGNYVLQPKDKPLTEQLFTSANVSGWDYDSPCNFALELRADSTYEQSCNGGSFEAARYRGTWKISNDSLFLQPLFEVYGWDASEEITALNVDAELLLITSANTLQVRAMGAAAAGRTIIRE
jgi:hypothetical protein